MIGTIISSFIMVIIAFYIWNNLTDKPFSWSEFRVYIFVCINSIATLFNYFNTFLIFKVINMTLIFIVIYKYLYNESLKKAILNAVWLESLFVIAETLFSIIVVAFLKDSLDDFINNFFCSILSNLAISFLTLAFSKLSIFKNIYFKFESIIVEVDDIKIIILSILSLFIYNVFAINTYYGLDPKILLFISMTISIISFILVFFFFKAKDDYYKLCEKYNSSLLSLREFENVLSNYRIDNHENKNQLLTIRNMTKNKKIITFIDTILNNRIKDSDDLMHETSIIPSGGLRGLIYSKMLVMSNKKIECELDVARNIRTIDMLNYDDNMLLDICKITGIFLDNAIEEVDNLGDKYIIIEMYIENNNFKIMITNIFDTSINKDNIYKVGYSTKGENHGYGLSLVKKITDKNRNLKTHHEINGDEFTQVLEIKIEP